MSIWISVQEAATRLGVTHVSVRNWLAQGRLKGQKIAGLQVVDSRSVAKLAEKRQQKAVAQ